MAQYSGQTNTSITTTLMRSGKVASRVAEPATIRAEHESSKVALITAAIPGSSSGTMDSPRNSTIVVSQPAIFVSPELRNTAAMATRNISWTVGSGKGSSKAAA